MKLTIFADGWGVATVAHTRIRLAVDVRGRPSHGRPIGENGAMTFERVAWTITVLVALLTAFLLLLAGYKGYAGVSAAVGAAAAINLF
jgi:hypothetical protein